MKQFIYHTRLIVITFVIVLIHSNAYTQTLESLDSLFGKRIEDINCFNKTWEGLWFVTSSHIASAQECQIENTKVILAYNAYNNKHVIEYIEIMDTNFILYNKFRIGMSYQQVIELEKSEIKIEQGWMAYQVLPSGWCIVFNYWKDAKDNSSNWELPKSEWKVKFFFKRK